MYCPKCGTAIAANERFCGACGTQVAQQTPNRPQQTNPGPQMGQGQPQRPPQQPPFSPQYQPHQHQPYQSPPPMQEPPRDKVFHLMPYSRIPRHVVVQSIVIFAFGLLAAFLLFFSGLSMSDIQSVGGKTMEEVFYKHMGHSLIGLSAFVLASTMYFAARLSNHYLDKK